MSTATFRHKARGTRSVPDLETGDCLTQAEFHRRYEAYSDDVKFELVGGVVYMASPVSVEHSDYHQKLGYVFAHYEAFTPGVHALDNATVILGDHSEPQPDLALRIRPECGGQSRTVRTRSGGRSKQYVLGSPELIAEIAHSSVAIDLHQKKNDYQQAGVGEYVVVCVEESKVFWFDSKSRGTALRPAAQAIQKSRMFPGLWIDVPALWALDSRRLLKTLEQGLASPEHAAFVQKLAAAKRRTK